MLPLITIPFSHFNEKARWALERFGVPYREERYLTGFHFVPVAVATRLGRDGTADRISSRFSTPVLVLEDGARICDSQRIVTHVSSRYAPPELGLYPSAEVAELERRLGDELGARTRRVA